MFMFHKKRELWSIKSNANKLHATINHDSNRRVVICSSCRLVICNGWQRQLNGNRKMIWYIYECVENDEKLLNSRKRVSCNHIFHAAHFKKDIFFYEKNHALLVREPISFMLKQTFFDSMHVYIAWSAVSSIQNKYYHISELRVSY